MRFGLMSGNSVRAVLRSTGEEHWAAGPCAEQGRKTVIQESISNKELDRRLDVLAQDHESFTERARELAVELNAAGLGLEIEEPTAWRKPSLFPARRGVASIEEQLRTEIDSIERMDREPEAQLARRIEFARIRLSLVLAKHGMTDDDLEGKVQYHPSTFRNIEHTGCHLHFEICQRWIELHALRTELVERNLYLVLINVERYAHLKVSRLDLIQEGSTALFRAVDGFDWRRGLLFRTYAVHWLNQAFRSFLYNFGSTVRVPVYLQKAMKHVKLARERLGSAATADEIAVEADLSVHLVESALAASRSTLSMDSPLLSDDDAGGLGEVLKDPTDEGIYSTSMEEISLEEGIQRALARLSDRERYVVQMRFGIGEDRDHTLSEVAKVLGVSLERVRQIQVRAVNKMRTPGLRKAIDPFL
jgi:RNA polymerase sigma factor (sigma-70 family)